MIFRYSCPLLVWSAVRIQAGMQARILVTVSATYSDGIPRKGLKLSWKELLDCSSNTAIVHLFKTVASLF